MPDAPKIDYDAIEIARDAADFKEEIFIIESPDSDDLFFGRNEGDALTKTLQLAEISVTYYLATNEETFYRALDDIVIRINHIKRTRQDWPFIHISAHGYDDGLELTDGTTLYWDQLSRRLSQVTDLVGYIALPKIAPQDIPRINLSLSSCSAYLNYEKSLSKPYPFHMMIGPIQDIGWCQALIAYSTFFYKSFIQKHSFGQSLRSMNDAAGEGGEIIFKALYSHDANKVAHILAGSYFSLKEESDN